MKDLSDPRELSSLLICSPEIVINCLSLREYRKQPFELGITTYSLIPKLLANISMAKKFKVLHISSDGVFSGEKGGSYSEDDLPDACDDYGKAKLLGEISSPTVLNIRTSFIGFDPLRCGGLLEWFIQQKKCNLFTKSVFSGLPTATFAKILQTHVLNDLKMDGIIHIASKPVSKLECLFQVSNALGLDIDIVPVDGPKIDRSLSMEKFTQHTGYQAESWQALSVALLESRYLTYRRASLDV